jgi:hypothetical protein
MSDFAVAGLVDLCSPRLRPRLSRVSSHFPTQDPPRIEARVFVIGCPRSGTTLLQSLLAAHPKIGSFPESQFFLTFAGKPQRYRRMYGEHPSALADRARLAITEILLRLGIAPRSGELAPAFLASVPNADIDSLTASRLLGRRTSAFVRLLDTVTAERGETIWVEKSPLHYGFVDVIERFVPMSKFIHLNRSGIDVVASLRWASLQYPDRKPWSSFANLDRCIGTWLAASRSALENAGRPNHHVAEYEELATEPEAALKSICDFIDVSYNPAMLTGYSEAAPGLVGDEPWKEGVKGPIQAGPSKFERLLSLEEQAYVRERVSGLPEISSVSGR